MLNEHLYEILVDLGADKDKAKEAAKEDKELLIKTATNATFVVMIKAQAALLDF
ncbi:hypothetical protein [Endozoicomonas euniceicola]|uniref:Uncharacterized protein n=1 Tax=Endozoicomonas euniceicola TaxID=1234143 RepID=A0ABY6GZI4_9GAMM|nr:hypothetical protein [Endozoicomonas euniceicola]UYM18209.1 hypothetical protein NX720_09980 [Endozoicomonas euniceicola]